METIDLAGLAVPIQDFPNGPSVMLNDTPLEALGWVMNLAVQADSDKLRDALMHGKNGGDLGGWIRLVRPDDDIEDDRRRWRELTGNDLVATLVYAGSDLVKERVVVPLDALRMAIEVLRRLRAERAKPPPWLFAVPSIWHMPAGENEWAMLATLERRAAALDRRVAGLGGEIEPADLINDRQVLLRDFERAGLLNGEQKEAKTEWLSRLQLPTLASIYSAALEIHEYLRSDERQEKGLEPARPSILSTSVTIDLFRSGLIGPANVSRFEWAAFGESLLREIGEIESDEGEVSHRDEHGGLVTARWRKDDGKTPALVALSIERS